MSTDPEAGPQPHPDVRRSPEIQEESEDPGEVCERAQLKGGRVVIGRPVVRRSRCCSVPALIQHLLIVLLVLILGGLYARYIFSTVERQNLLLETQQLQNTINDLNNTLNEPNNTVNEPNNTVTEQIVQKSEVQAKENSLEDQQNTRKEELCPNGWKRYQCKCYKLSTENKTWVNSRADCQHRGADLVTIKSRKEEDFVSRLSEHEDFWIGLEVTPSWDPKWIWVDGTPAEYMNFPKGTKVNPGSKNYFYKEKNGPWKSVTDGTKRWICEKPVPEPNEDDEV
ncbi:CD209 antigen-like protein E [Sphaeramia orbicularis]|uniref:CD209 antigen-like protein E n=1 Tax=Sphaeramia orbicularis TaxID=375764 RepID=A0A673BP95_9TELE|nr:CD209 antigen-like protein E [Sphaeramia orbicularis]